MFPTKGNRGRCTTTRSMSPSHASLGPTDAPAPCYAGNDLHRRLTSMSIPRSSVPPTTGPSGLRTSASSTADRCKLLPALVLNTSLRQKLPGRASATLFAEADSGATRHVWLDALCAVARPRGGDQQGRPNCWHTASPSPWSAGASIVARLDERPACRMPTASLPPRTQVLSSRGSSADPLARDRQEARRNPIRRRIP